MTLSASNVRVGVTGLVSAGLTSATAPTGTGSTLTGFTDLGYVSEDGVSVAIPDSGDSTPIRAWQGNTVVRTITGSTDDVPTVSLTLIETKVETLQYYYGIAVSGQTSTEGAFVVDSSAARSEFSLVVDVVDGTALKRIYLPNAFIASVGEQVFANGEAIGFPLVIEGRRNSTLGYNAKVWDTSAKTP